MLDLYDELTGLMSALTESDLDFAVCGGVAMAVHGFTRATEDIDLFIRPEDLEGVEKVAASCGFTFQAKPMNFSGGAMQIRRVTKIDAADGDVLTLDLLLVTPETERVWLTREVKSLRGRPFPVVSREGLVTLKLFRSSDQDIVDIKRLQSDE